MDFSLTDEQAAFADLSAQVLSADDAGLCAPAEVSGRTVLRRLADTGLLRALLPEEFGGASLGAVGTALLLQEVGRNAVGAPVAPVLALAMVPLVSAGDALLDGIAAGEVLVVGARPEPYGHRPSAPGVIARPGGTDRVTLEGTNTEVAAADAADAFVVPARLDGDTVLTVVERDAPGLTVGGDIPGESRVVFAGAPARVLLSGPSADEALERAWQHALLASAATVAGACERALRLVRSHVATRRQFGRALAEFQAVSLRVADAHIDVESIRVATLNAAWHLDEYGTASAPVLVAKAWAGDGGNRVLRAAHHLHGGLGVDLTYPLHVLSRLVRREELAYGPPDHHIARIGELIAAGAIDQET
jgi:alkylation response protein AidB-like acyl-CoA dehydrogenase